MMRSSLGTFVVLWLACTSQSKPHEQQAVQERSLPTPASQNGRPQQETPEFAAPRNTAQRGAPHPAGPAEPPCALEENCDCPVPGVTIRWLAAYCMAVNETDDEANPAVSDCMTSHEAQEKGESACDANRRWKEKLCAQAPGVSDVQACVKDPSFLPYPVPSGIGG